MAHIVSVSVCEPVVVADIAVLTVHVHRVRGPVQAADSIFFEAPVARPLAIEQFDRGVTRGMTVAGHFVGGLLIDRNDTPLRIFLVRERAEAPIQSRFGLCTPPWIPLR